jgi:flavin-dependent dehydrogenase
MDAVLMGAAVAVMGDASVMVNTWRWGGGRRAVIDAAFAAETQVFKGRLSMSY